MYKCFFFYTKLLRNVKRRRHAGYWQLAEYNFRDYYIINEYAARSRRTSHRKRAFVYNIISFYFHTHTNAYIIITDYIRTAIFRELFICFFFSTRHSHKTVWTETHLRNVIGEKRTRRLHEAPKEIRLILIWKKKYFARFILLEGIVFFFLLGKSSLIFRHRNTLCAVIEIDKQRVPINFIFFFTRITKYHSIFYIFHLVHVGGKRYKIIYQKINENFRF